MQIPVRLEAHPKLRRCLQQLRESQCRVGSDAALADDDLVEAIERNPKSACGIHLAELHRLQELLEQDLTSRDRRSQPLRIPSDSLRRGLRRHVPVPSGTSRDTGR